MCKKHDKPAPANREHKTTDELIEIGRQAMAARNNVMPRREDVPLRSAFTTTEDK